MRFAVKSCASAPSNAQRHCLHTHLNDDSRHADDVGDTIGIGDLGEFARILRASMLSVHARIESSLTSFI
jgi:hypothetical protein